MQPYSIITFLASAAMLVITPTAASTPTAAQGDHKQGSWARKKELLQSELACYRSATSLDNSQPTTPAAVAVWYWTASQFNQPSSVVIQAPTGKPESFCMSHWVPTYLATPPASSVQLAKTFSSWQAAKSSWRNKMYSSVHQVASACMEVAAKVTDVDSTPGMAGAERGAGLVLMAIATDMQECATAVSLLDMVKSTTATTVASSSSSAAAAATRPRETMGEGVMAGAMAVAGIVAGVAVL